MEVFVVAELQGGHSAGAGAMWARRGAGQEAESVAGLGDSEVVAAMSRAVDDFAERVAVGLWRKVLTARVGR
jgi:hypothetical protein